MLQTNFLHKKLRSKKGFTLVETICAITIFAIVTVGVLNAVAFSREMVHTNNAREKASDKAQLVADELITAATGVDPSVEGATLSIVNKMNAFAVERDDLTSQDVQVEAIGNANYVETFAEPDPSGDNKIIQYTLQPVVEDTDEETRSIVEVSSRDQEITYHVTKRAGWYITVRVYYHEIGGSDWRAVEQTAFAPKIALGMD